MMRGPRIPVVRKRKKERRRRRRMFSMSIYYYPLPCLHINMGIPTLQLRFHNVYRYILSVLACAAFCVWKCTSVEVDTAYTQCLYKL
ncbi:hypothetical protein B0T09DRAFT_347801 [Sordaria sp. MPI-SDFR-AT-0083]|nr:hypothetical protein B0T09DRAFT_347801 [Sordaria sp. MPI-SDFR-AT-0083]